jgi:hypothetical protein
VSLGWAADGESGIGIFQLSEEAIAKELLDRHRSEHAWLPTKLEQEMDEAATVALLRQDDPEAATTNVKKKLLARGTGVSLWLLDAATFERWCGAWNKRHEAMEQWLESGGTSGYDTAAVATLSQQFWSIFEKPPVAEIPLGGKEVDVDVSHRLANEVWRAIVKTLGVCETSS